VPRPFPSETVRDLLGIARLLYRTWSGHGVPRDSRLPELVAIGKDLQESLRMAKTARTPRQYRDAWERAEVATRKLSYMLDAYVAVRPLVESTFSTVDQSAGEDKVAKARRR
jgi:hypothetical protein